MIILIRKTSSSQDHILREESSGLILNTRDINDSAVSVSLDLKVHYIQTNVITDLVTVVEEGGNKDF